MQVMVNGPQGNLDVGGLNTPIITSNQTKIGFTCDNMKPLVSLKRDTHHPSLDQTSAPSTSTNCELLSAKHGGNNKGDWKFLVSG